MEPQPDPIQDKFQLLWEESPESENEHLHRLLFIKGYTDGMEGNQVNYDRRIIEYKTSYRGFYIIGWDFALEIK